MEKKPTYPSPAQIRRVLEAVRAVGFEVAALKISNDGEVTVIDKSVLSIKDKREDLSQFV